MNMKEIFIHCSMYGRLDILRRYISKVSKRTINESLIESALNFDLSVFNYLTSFTDCNETSAIVFTLNYDAIIELISGVVVTHDLLEYIIGNDRLDIFDLIIEYGRMKDIHYGRFIETALVIGNEEILRRLVSLRVRREEIAFTALTMGLEWGERPGNAEYMKEDDEEYMSRNYPRTFPVYLLNRGNDERFMREYDGESEELVLRLAVMLKNERVVRFLLKRIEKSVIDRVFPLACRVGMRICSLFEVSSVEAGLMNARHHGMEETIEYYK